MQTLRSAPFLREKRRICRLNARSARVVSGGYVGLRGSRLGTGRAVSRGMTTTTNELRCPNCDRKLRGTEIMEHATLVIQRTCPGCRMRWQVVIAPGKRIESGPLAGAITQVAEWTGEYESVWNPNYSRA